MKIVIGKDGNVTMIANEAAEDLIKVLGGQVQKTRASHVEPCDIVLRVFFRAIRSLVSDQSRIAQWTRSWPVDWRVDLRRSNGPIVEAFDCRHCAIRFEIEWLEENRFGRR